MARQVYTPLDRLSLENQVINAGSVEGLDMADFDHPGRSLPVVSICSSQRAKHKQSSVQSSKEVSRRVI